MFGPTLILSYNVFFPRIPVQKHCILVCNSKPYQLPSQEGSRYLGFNCDQLAAMMAQVRYHGFICDQLAVMMAQVRYLGLTVISWLQ